MMHTFDEVLEHGFGNLEIGNHTVFQRPDSRNVGRCAAQHTFGFLSDVQLSAGSPMPSRVDGYHGGLREHNTLAAHVNQGVGGTQIYG